MVNQANAPPADGLAALLRYGGPGLVRPERFAP
jgi:hypothetical protein